MWAIIQKFRMWSVISGGKYNRFVITKTAHPLMRRFEGEWSPKSPDFRVNVKRLRFGLLHLCQQFCLLLLEFRFRENPFFAQVIQPCDQGWNIRGSMAFHLGFFVKAE